MLDFRLGGRLGPQSRDESYDVVIIGGGPAGLAAALYVARSGRSVALVEKGLPGGQMATTERVENCPGCIEGSGAQIGEWMRRQATGFGLKFVNAEVKEVRLGEDPKVVVIDGGRISARAVIIATGARPRRLGIPGEQEYWGRGVAVCSTCDGPFAKGLTVAVIGGGDSAVKEGEYLTRFADKVVILHRRDSLRAERANQRRAFANPKVEFRFNTVAEEIYGDEKVRGVRIRDVVTGERSDLPVGMVFVYVGMIPNTDLVRGQVEMDEWGYIVTDGSLATSVPGVYAVGDVRVGAVRQIVTAAADGAIAARALDEYLQEKENAGLASSLDAPI